MKIALRVLSVSLICLSWILAAQANAQQTKAIKDPKVSLVTCMPSFFGAESIVMVPVFSVSNPNPSLMEVKMDYQLTAGEQVIGKSMLPVFYVPSNTTVEIRDACVLPFKLFHTEKVLGGKSSEQSTEIVGEMWKGLSGARPDMISEEVWKRFAGKKPVLTASGLVQATAQKQKKVVHFTSEWQE